jgi:signal transduction histidine kinase/CheY-like chemotaxis protein
MTPLAENGETVLVLAPTGRDSSLITEMLQRETIPCHICAGVDGLAERLGESAGLALLAEEALIGVSLAPMLRALDKQPAWSDFPLLFLTTTGSRPTETSMDLLKLLGDEANVTILERPIRMATLLSSVRSAHRARRRQYQVRDYLARLKQKEEELLQTQKLESLGVLAGGVAHDFNNLLTGIMGNASLAIECLPREARHLRTVLEDVVSASERAAHLTRQLLAYAGKGRFIIERIDLSEIVRAITHLIQSSIPKNACLRLELADDLDAVEADATQLQQIVMNLVINAAEAIPADRSGEVVVTTRNEELGAGRPGQAFAAGEAGPGRYVVLEVRDTGQGMDDATRARIFDPFFTTKFTGRGLGLAAVLGIVRSHKAALEVQSAPGAGSTFRVLFPAVSAAVTGDVGRGAGDGAAARRDAATILIIDDEETVRRAAKATLDHYGYETILANDGKQGVEIFTAMPDRISLVLLDLTMPGIGGEEVLRRLKAIRPHVRVILSSGFNEMEVIERFNGAGLAGFLQKPYAAGTLAARLRSVLAPGRIGPS